MIKVNNGRNHFEDDHPNNTNDNNNDDGAPYSGRWTLTQLALTKRMTNIYSTPITQLKITRIFVRAFLLARGLDKTEFFSKFAKKDGKSEYRYDILSTRDYSEAEIRLGKTK